MTPTTTASARVLQPLEMRESLTKRIRNSPGKNYPDWLAQSHVTYSRNNNPNLQNFITDRKKKIFSTISSQVLPEIS
jgi:hypothetical protein